MRFKIKKKAVLVSSETVFVVGYRIRPYKKHLYHGHMFQQSYEDKKLRDGYNNGKSIIQIRAEMLSEKRKLVKKKVIPILRFQEY